MKSYQSLKMRWLVWVWKHTPNCAEMSRLASLSLDQPLPFKVRCQMRLHHLICAWCLRYQKHLQFLHQAAPRMRSEIENAAQRGLSPEARQRIVQRLYKECRH
jgi:hypothetical protein